MLAGVLTGCGVEHEAPAPGTPVANPTLATVAQVAELPLSTEDEQRMAAAIELLRGGLPERVTATLGPLLERDPVPVDAQYAAGQAAYMLARYAESVARLGDAVARNPELLPRSTSLGFAHYKLGDFDRAREVFAAITDREPDSIKALYGMGQVALTVGEMDVARTHLQRVLALEPLHDKARFSLARVHEAGGRLDEALREVVAVVERRPSHEEALYLQGTILAALGRAAEAQVVLDRRAAVYETKELIGGLEQRLRSGDDSPQLRLQIIQAFLDMGDLREALRVLRTGLILWPQDPGLLEMRERLTSPR